MNDWMNGVCIALGYGAGIMSTHGFWWGVVAGGILGGAIGGLLVALAMAGPLELLGQLIGAGIRVLIPGAGKKS